MKALVFNGVGFIALEDVKEPHIEDPRDAIVKITGTTICGTDLHLVRGTMHDVQKGTILGHEGIGIVEKVGKDVRLFKVGDRVLIPSTVGCGSCSYCIKKEYALCDVINKNGPDAGVVFYGGPKSTGPLQGMQAEKVRVPYADANLFHIPADMTDEQAIILSDILPTAYMAVENAAIAPEDTVAVFGCGPIGQMVIACLKQYNVEKIFAIDNVLPRLRRAQEQGAIPINFDTTDPVKKLKELTAGAGPKKIIDAVGVDAEQPKGGLISYFKKSSFKKQFEEEVKDVAPDKHPHDGYWYPGTGPSQVLQWATDAIAKNGVISIIGAYPESLRFFSIGKIFDKNVTITMGACNHRKYIPIVLEWVKQGIINPGIVITHKLPFSKIEEAYKKFDRREDNCIKIMLLV